MQGKDIFEGIGGTISEDFEAFLKYRFDEVIEHTNLKKWSAEERRYIGPFEISEELETAGLDPKTADELGGDILCRIVEVEEEAYVKGAKDGFKMALHLLGMAPENKKEASQ